MLIWLAISDVGWGHFLSCKLDREGKDTSL